MKRYVFAALCAITLLMLSGCMARVPAGNVGIKFNKFGSNKGVDIQDVGPGYYWLGFNWDMYLFPTFTQNYTWTKAADENSAADESFTFQTIEGLSVNADVGITYHIQPDKAALVFQKYRRGVDEITNVFLRNMVRDALNRAASTMPIESVYGAGKSKLMDTVVDDVQAECAPIGIDVEKIYWIGDLRLPPNVTSAINQKIQATQNAQRTENEVASAKADAQKEVARAQGDAQATLARAQAEAEAIRIKGEALRSNPEIIELNRVQKWNGVLPVYMLGSGANTFFQIPAAQGK